jgi:hypothetical protein
LVIDQRTIIAMIEIQAPSNDARMAVTFLVDKDARSLEGNPNIQTAHRALLIWRPRQWNLRRKGIPGYGIDLLIENLERLHPTEEIIKYAFVSPQGTGQFFFRKCDKTMLGYVVVLK